MNFCSAFAGIGGFDLGFERAGWTSVSQIEIDTFIMPTGKKSITGRYAKKVLAHHWPDVPRLDDIRKVTGDQLGNIDVLVGGFPCQDTSKAAPDRHGLRGARSHAFFDFARLADESRPEWVILENPDGILSSNGGADMGTVLQTLADIGYVGGWRTLDLRGFDSPQRRRRVLTVGHLGDDARARAVLPDPEARGEHPLSSAQREGRAESRSTTGASTADRRGRLSFRKSARARATVPCGGYETWVDEDVTNTLTGFDSGVAHATQLIVEGDRVRALTYTEKERLMGFPDGWTDVPGVTDSARDTLLGNSMAPNIAEWLARRIDDCMIRSCI